MHGSPYDLRLPERDVGNGNLRIRLRHSSLYEELTERPVNHWGKLARADDDPVQKWNDSVRVLDAKII
jgi:hypothetical protein